MGEGSNVLMGSGQVYYADVDTALPTDLNTTTDGSLTWTSWNEVGYKDGGAELEYNPEFTRVVVDEHHAPIRIELTGEEAKLRVFMAETDADHITLAIAGATKSTVAKGAAQVAQDIVKIGSKASTTEKAVCVVGKSPEGYYRLIHIPKCVSVEKIALKSKKREKKMCEVVFEAIADTTADAGEDLITMYDMTDLKTG